MRVRILGSAAGGGLPQWNCHCPNCHAVRLGSPDVSARTQSSVAVSADGQRWFLLNVSPDVRQQAVTTPELGSLFFPEQEQTCRGTAIAGCLLTDAELDHSMGLLMLREGDSFPVYCTALVHRWLTDHLPIAIVLSYFNNPSWSDLPLDIAFGLPLPGGEPSGLRVRAFEMVRHVPRFVPEMLALAIGSVVGLEVEDVRTGGKLVYAPCVAVIGDNLDVAARRADCILLDGTFWSDDELIRLGIAPRRTAREMGHLPVAGPEGSLAWLSKLPARHRIYVHINNTNPMLNRRSREFQTVEETGVRVGMDGDIIDL